MCPVRGRGDSQCHARPGPAVDADSPAVRRDAADQQRRRRHQLRDARVRPTAARLRLRRAGQAGRRQAADDHRPPGQGRRKAQDPRQRRPRTRAGQPGDRRHRRADRPGRRHGRARHRSDRRNENDLARIGEFRLRLGPQDGPAVQPVQRGEHAVQQGDSPGDRSARGEAGGPVPGQVRRRRGAGRPGRRVPGPAAAAGRRPEPQRDRPAARHRHPGRRGRTGADRLAVRPGTDALGLEGDRPADPARRAGRGRRPDRRTRPRVRLRQTADDATVAGTPGPTQ